MSYHFMRLILMFDLPIVTKKQKRIYANFRKWLLQRGYLMLQYSIYVKIFANNDSLEQHKIVLKKNTPKEGQIRLITLTEKQFARMDIILGGKSNQEDKLTVDPFVHI